jgi:hypothetical protein
MTNQVTVQFAKGGFIINKTTEEGTTTEVVNSTGKLNKALREIIAELSLLPKKSDDASEE